METYLIASSSTGRSSYSAPSKSYSSGSTGRSSYSGSSSGTGRSGTSSGGSTGKSSANSGTTNVTGRSGTGTTTKSTGRSAYSQSVPTHSTSNGNVVVNNYHSVSYGYGSGGGWGYTPFFPYSYGYGYNPWFYLWLFDRPAYQQTVVEQQEGRTVVVSRRDHLIGDALFIGFMLILLVGIVLLTRRIIYRRKTVRGSGRGEGGI